jgi:hypothetical protein
MLPDSPRRLTLEELLGLQNPAQRLDVVAALRQRPSGGGDRPSLASTVGRMGSIK